MSPPVSTVSTRPDLAATLGLSASPRRARLVRGLTWAVILAAGAAVAWWAFRSGSSAEVYEYRTETVTRGNLVLTVTATGALEPLTQVTVGTEISGVIESVAVEEGARVRAGQVLATVNTDKLRAQLDQSQAAKSAADARLVQARAGLADAERELARFEDMFKRSGGQLPAQRDLDQARTAVRSSEADEASALAGVTQAEASLAAIRIELAKATIRSPINGVVLESQVDKGQTVAASFQTPELFTLAEDLTRMRLSVAVDEADIGQVRVGQAATFTVDAYPGQRFSSKVVEIRSLPQTVDGVVTYETRLEVDNVKLLLRPGMTATADITVTEVTDALLLPNAALRFEPPVTEEAPTKDDEGGLLRSIMPGPPGRRGQGPASSVAADGARRVWILEGGALTPVAVTLGVSDGSFTEIKGGALSAGSQVVVDYDVRGGS